MGVSRYCILVFDNNTDQLEFIRSILKKKDFDVRFVHTLEEVKNHITSYRLLVIFLDNYLSGDPNIDLIPEIKSIDENIKIIVISADPAVPSNKTFSDKMGFIL